MQPDLPVYNLPVALRLKGELSTVALRASLQMLLDRHEALRTTFVASEAGPLQRIQRTSTIAFDRIVMPSAHEIDPESWLRQVVRQAAAEPFDLERGPLFRARLNVLADNDHALVLAMHHIISDGWSLNVLLSEFGELYNAICANRKARVDDLPIQYADYAVWQREQLQGDELRRQLGYWNAELAGAPRMVNLPLARFRSELQTFAGDSKRFMLPSRVAGALRSLGCGESATLFMALLAAFALVLTRYTGQYDTLIGYPTAGRSRSELENVVGFFVNTLVIRLNTKGNPSFREVLQRVRRAAVGAYANQDVPFERLVQELVPDRTPGAPPLVQVLFMLQSMEKATLNLSEIDVSPIESGIECSKLDLVVAFQETEESLHGIVGYNVDLFDDGMISALTEDLEWTLRTVVDQPDVPLASLYREYGKDRAGEGHVKTTISDADLASSPLDLFQRQVERRPRASALTLGVSSLTYEELDARSTRIAKSLRGRGIGPESVVGIQIPRSFEAIAVALAVMKAGAAYLPIEPNTPAERAAFMLRDSGAQMVIAHKAEWQLAESQRLYSVVDPSQLDEALCDDRALPSVGPDNLAYIIYTSGSTGAPKGVMVAHRQIVSLLSDFQSMVGLTPSDRVLHSTALSFDVSVIEVFGTLCMGGTLVVPAEDIRTSNSFSRLMRDENVTTLFAVPSWFREIMKYSRHREQWTLKRIIFAGEPLSANLVTDCQAFGDIAVYNFYGPTEATVYCTGHEVGNGPTVSIGRALPSAAVFVLDPLLQRLPTGVAGEIHVAGSGVARGYVGSGGTTARKFIPNPYEKGSRLYRTGDWGRWNADGTLQFLGRRDRQVKIRGFRVELEEVEAALLRISEISAAAATIEQDPSGNDRLVGFVVLNPGPQGSADAESLAEVALRLGGQGATQTLDGEEAAGRIRRILAGSLPTHMVPSIIHVTSSLPTKANGKIDFGSLGAIRRRPTRPPSRTTTSAETEIIQIWREALGVGEIDVGDDFFEIGGHSLMAVGVIFKINTRFSTNLSVATLFIKRTISALAFAVAESLDGAAPASSVLVNLKAGADKNPMVLFHGAGGSISCYEQLASNMPASVPVFAVEARGLAQDNSSRLSSIFDMAEYYASAIAAQGLNGPLLLGGWSMGAFIALETARRLTLSGHKVASLLIMYTPNVLTVPKQYTDESVVRAFARENGLKFDVCQSRLADDADRGESALVKAYAVFRNNIAALSGYEPESIHLDAALFRASDHPYPPNISADRSLGWRSVIHGRLDVIDTPGDHDTMLSAPAVGALALNLTNYFAGERSAVPL